MLGHDSDTTVDRALDALRHPRRRRLLFALLEERERSGPDARCDITSVFDEGDEELHVELLHVHLPKLEELGYIDWRRGDRAVEPGPRWTDIEPVLDLIHNHLDELPPTLRGTPT